MVYRKNLIKRRKTFFERRSLTELIILANFFAFFAFFIIFWIFGKSDPEKLISYFALNPSYFSKGYVWTIFTSMFLHVGFAHLFVNMISMFFIGNFVEKLIGKKRYLWFYLISGIVAGLFFVGLAYVGQYIPYGDSLFGDVNAFALGASGSLFGLGGLLAVLIPRLKVLIFFIIPMPLWLGMTLLMFGLWAVSFSAGLPIGNTAHFGGLIVGLIYGFYIRNKYSRKVRMLNKMFK
ncbi:hypothetical protein CXT76_01420 [Candidatus Parvarchaeota archaeon]|jgi:membrane associated rhomboid family serine protease|nr:MAG: hypothetical protein CXT76_01420 [Candidatus Parvarchaeota archaeon]HIG52145.1 rhomboid family intramembrane serine protease [Candidatus Pacearchaeota archaeon]